MVTTEKGTTAAEIIAARGMTMNFDDEGGEGAQGDAVTSGHTMESAVTQATDMLIDEIRTRRGATDGAEGDAAGAGDAGGDADTGGGNIRDMLHTAFVRGQQFTARPFSADERENSERRGHNRFDLAVWLDLQDQRIDERAAAREVRLMENYRGMAYQPAGIDAGGPGVRIPDAAVLAHLVGDPELAALAHFFSSGVRDDELAPFGLTAADMHFAATLTNVSGQQQASSGATPSYRAPWVEALQPQIEILDLLMPLTLADGVLEVPRWTAALAAGVIAEAAAAPVLQTPNDMIAVEPNEIGFTTENSTRLAQVSPAFRPMNSAALVRHMLLSLQASLQKYILDQSIARVNAADRIPHNPASMGIVGVGGVRVYSGGSGFVQGTDTIAFAPPRGGGTTATGTLNINNGAISGVDITQPGQYEFDESPVITLGGGSGSGAVVRSQLIDGDVDGALFRQFSRMMTKLDDQRLPQAGRVLWVNQRFLDVARSVSADRAGFWGSCLAEIMDHASGVRWSTELGATANAFLGMPMEILLARWGGLWRLADPFGSGGGLMKHTMKVFIDTDDRHPRVASTLAAS